MEKKVLYINACARSESRTDRIARALLERLGGLQEEVKLAEMDLQPLSEEADYTDAMFDLARQFQQADEIVIAAPYWDLSFPAILKLYLENIYVTGLVSEYTETGRSHGLCLAGKLWYVTTAGGSYLSDFSCQYLHTLAAEYFGIPETELICAEMLDVEGFDADNLVAQQIGQIQKRKLL